MSGSLTKHRYFSTKIIRLLWISFSRKSKTCRCFIRKSLCIRKAKKLLRSFERFEFCYHCKKLIYSCFSGKGKSFNDDWGLRLITWISLKSFIKSSLLNKCFVNMNFSSACPRSKQRSWERKIIRNFGGVLKIRTQKRRNDVLSSPTTC